MWTWDASALVLDSFRSGGIEWNWKAVVVEGRFLPGDVDGTSYDFRRLDSLVCDVLWDLNERLNTELTLEEGEGTQPVPSKGRLAGMLPTLLGRSDYRLIYRRQATLRAIAFDIDIDWLVIMCGASLSHEIEERVRHFAVKGGRRVTVGP